uniref:Ankyrin repeat and SOCS box containing 2 n=1 Tax=Pavo cristatus TaxID=9049 RepID=A0A8C9LFU1_PAVCR
MATKAANTQRQTIGSEEYSLYSSLSEDELINMAIRQSLGEDPVGGPTEAAVPRCASSHNPPYHLYPWQSTVFVMGKHRREAKNQELDPVVAAIRDGDEKEICNMMKSGKDLSEPNKDGWLPLHEAAYYGQVGCLRLLQKAYPGTIDQRTLNEETALFLATSRGNLDCLLALLQAGAEPDISNKARETPLYKACERKNAEAARLLVQYNADTNHRCNRGWTALHEAVSRNDLETMDILVKGGAKIESTNSYGITSLFVAAESGQLEALRYLAKCGEYSCAIGTPLLISSGHCSQAEDVQHLKRDNSPLLTDSPLDRIVSMLIPVTSRIRVKRSGISPLHLAAERNNDDILEELIDAGYEVNTTLSNERSCLYEDRRTTPLYFAVFNNNIYATELLLQAGANPNVDLINPLLISIRHGCLKTMKLLLDHGANIDAYISSHPTTFPATIMFSMKYLSVLKYLLDLGCDAVSCFQCQYGNCPHPALNYRRDRYNDPQLSKEPTITQFCDMVSTPEISRWAGPIIDVLLDYVGNVQLCSRLKEHIDSYEDWAVIKEKAEPPRPLAHLCRVKVRSLIGRNRIKLIDTLPLPYRLIRYLQHDYTQ